MPILVLILGASYWQWNQSQEVSLKPTYQEHTVSKGNIDIKVLATGVVQPRNRIEIKPPVAGRVEEALAKEGQVVKKGEIIAWMSSS